MRYQMLSFDSAQEAVQQYRGQKKHRNGASHPSTGSLRQAQCIAGGGET